MSTLPCTTRLDVYDALLDAELDTQAYKAAHDQAAQLCGACPRPCIEKVTATSAPRTVQDFDDTEWIPAPAPAVLLPLNTVRRSRVYWPPTGRDYVQPDRRPTAWARMAAELADDGRTLPDIAAALCVDEATATALIESARHASKDAA
ncbi:hypothetical protein [Kitasatospora sp. NPDC090091]|uniref:hypothetical protein n=1 Tax=Kitasatospora sp. NPDC090091 TaxID=3364081 RepID=UPI0037FD125A